MNDHPGENTSGTCFSGNQKAVFTDETHTYCFRNLFLRKGRINEYSDILFGKTGLSSYYRGS
jgi:hypothetical protein